MVMVSLKVLDNPRGEHEVWVLFFRWVLTGPADTCGEQNGSGYSFSPLGPSTSHMFYTKAQIKVFSDKLISWIV